MYTLLIIDDNPDFRKVMVELIGRHFRDITVLQTDSCNGGRELVQQLSPDVVFLDINLPDGNGLSIIKEIQACSNEAKIIILSCADYPEYRSAADELGADIFLSKSTTPAQWMKTLARFIPQAATLPGHPPATDGQQPITNSKLLK